MFHCCCNDSADTQAAFSVQDHPNGPITDGAVVAAKQGMVNQLPITSTMEPLQPDTTRSKDSSQGQASSARSLTSEEKEKEKARLQTLVNTFVRTAAKGCPCTYLKEVTGERCSTRYFLDKRLEHLVIVASQDSTVAEVRCPISAIQDIYCFVEDGAGCFPAKVLGLLTPQEQEMLLMVVYRSDRGGTHRFCLLEETVSSRDTFLECLRILCIYMQSVASGGGNNPLAGLGNQKIK
jgi:hypothetical protein